MTNSTCAVCGKAISLLSGKILLSDGAVCADCLKSAGISVLSQPVAFTQQTIQAYIARRQEAVAQFRPTKTCSHYIEIDEHHRLFRLVGNLFDFDQLADFVLSEDGIPLATGGESVADTGKPLWVNDQKDRPVCRSMTLRVSFKSAHLDRVSIAFISTETKRAGTLYRQAKCSAQGCLAALHAILTSRPSSRRP